MEQTNNNNNNNNNNIPKPDRIFFVSFSSPFSIITQVLPTNLSIYLLYYILSSTLTWLAMECISNPIIAHPESDRDWDDQHVYHLVVDTKHPTPVVPLTRNAPVETKRRQVRHMRRHTVQNIKFAGMPKRVRFDRSAITKPSSGSAKNTKSRKEWEDLLKFSIEGLQGIYNKMGTSSTTATTTTTTATPTSTTPSAVQTSPVLGDRLPKPDLSGMDYTSMAFRAMQIACNSNPISSSQYQAEEYDGDMSSGSEDSFDSYDTEVDSPATPLSMMRMGSVDEDMDLDSGFMGMGIGLSP